MSRFKKWAVGLALAVATAACFAQPASAQTIPGADASTANPNEPTVAVTRDTVTGGYRGPRQGDNSIGIMTLSEFTKYRQAHPDEQSTTFDDIRTDNRSVCGRTGSWIREHLWIAAQVNDLGPETDSIRNDLVSLGRAENAAAWGRRGGEVVSTGLLCALSAGLYCGAAAANNLGNEFQGMAHDKAGRVNRHAGDLTQRENQVWLRAMLLNSEEGIAWAQEFHSYCLIVHPDATLGQASQDTGAPSATPASWGYWNDPQ